MNVFQICSQDLSKKSVVQSVKSGSRLICRTCKFSNVDAGFSAADRKGNYSRAGITSIGNMPAVEYRSKLSSA